MGDFTTGVFAEAVSLRTDSSALVSVTMFDTRCAATAALSK